MDTPAWEAGEECIIAEASHLVTDGGVDGLVFFLVMGTLEGLLRCTLQDDSQQAEIMSVLYGCACVTPPLL